MDIFTIAGNNGHKIEYKRIDSGTCYHAETPEAVVNILEHCREHNIRVRVWFGENGRSWDEENDTIGYIGRSTGGVAIPLLVKNSNSFGGGGLLDHCIVKIIRTDSKKVLYQHPKFSQAFFEADDSMVYKCKAKGERADAEIYANCDTWEQAQRLADFMNGVRNSK